LKWLCDYWFDKTRRCRNPGTYQSNERIEGYIPYYCWRHKK